VDGGLLSACRAGLLGLLLLGLALAWARRAPWWAPVAMLAGILGAPFYPFGTIAGGLLYLGGAGAIGLRMLRMSEAEWAGQSARSGTAHAVHGRSGPL
jgi:hypothetical protein